jgi:hypothetical protein
MDERVDRVLGGHLSAILGMEGMTAVIQQYVSALRTEGWDTPADFDNLPVDALSAEPLHFKAGHLKKVAQSRESREKGDVPQQLGPDVPIIRGQCSLCGVDVLDSQPRVKDPTGLYRHQDCEANTGATTLPNSTPRADAGVSGEAIAEAKANATKAAEEAQLEVAAIKAAARAARAKVIAEATREAEAALAQAQVDAALIKAVDPPIGGGALSSSGDEKSIRKNDHTTAESAVSSKSGAVGGVEEMDADVDQALAAHLAAILGMKGMTADIQQYVAALRSEGCDTTADFDNLLVDELKEEPFSFKRLHLKKVAQSRAVAEDTDALPTLASASQSLTTAESAVSEPAQSQTTSAPTLSIKPVLSMGPKFRPLLPDGKHAFLSYQWDVQEQVKDIKGLLNERNVKCWMDIDGGMKSDIYDSMAEGVQGAACVMCFMSQAYQDSANCKLELKFAQQSGVPIIPVMMQADFKAKGWLAILTAGSIWTPMYDSASVHDGIDKLIAQARFLITGSRGEDGDASDTASEVSGETASFDVNAWGGAIFSLDETREELERLREETAPSAETSTGSTGTGEDGSFRCCPLPAMVPTLVRGLFVTAEMEGVLDAVLSDTSTPQIGFCGMGGIGKTTVSCWVTRNDEVRTKFGMVAWIALGQTPRLDSCIALLHQQLTGSALPSGVSADQKHEFLQHAFLNRSVLLVLDDCWDAEVAKHFNWIDHSTNSKILISSRVRNVLEGGEIIDVAVPSQSDAVKMLLSTAGLDTDALQGREEVAHISELCKRLPLTVGVAGKLIRQLAEGSAMSDASDWADVVALLEEELKDPDSGLSIEESVIRASIKVIPKKIQKHVIRLFHGFALAPEDTHVPLPVIGMIFDACYDQTDRSKVNKPLSRLQVRGYLKVLIDRSLVLGTVDRPQLHDVMLDYVQKQLVGEPYKTAHRQLVEALRKSDRSKAAPVGKYIQQCVRHHIQESHDALWEKSPQAISWLEDHVTGVQDVIAASTAALLPVDALAKEAEDAGMWWQAALRWNALGSMKMAESGSHQGGAEHVKRAVSASAKAAAALSSDDGGTVNSTVVAAFTQFDLDSFDLYGLNYLFKSWNPALLGEFGERYRQVVATEAGRSRPLMRYAALASLDWLPGWLSGDQQNFANVNWMLSKLAIDLYDDPLSTEEDRAAFKPLAAYPLRLAGDACLSNMPGFSWDYFGANGDKLVEGSNAYKYEEHHAFLVECVSLDAVVCIDGNAFFLALQYGRVKDARKIVDANLAHMEKMMALPDAGFMLAVANTPCFIGPLYHILGLPKHVLTEHFATLGVTFDSVDERLDMVTKGAQGVLFSSMEGVGGLHSLPRYCWQLKALCVLNQDVPESKAIAWLESLPDNEAFIACSMTLPHQDSGAVFGSYQTCWIALANEKVGLCESALRFVDLQLEPDMLKAGTPLTKWPQVIALACKGRVLAKLSRHDEALVAFQAAVTTSKDSLSLMEAFAYRELANYVGGGDAADQAGKELEAKLKTFEGRMTREEFDGLTIAP